MALGDLPRNLTRLPPWVGGAAQAEDPAGETAAAAPEFSNTLVTATTTTKEALPPNPGRKYLLIQNRGTVAVYVTFGGKANSNAGIEIAAGGVYEPFVVPGSSISVITSSGSSNVVLVEGIG